MKKKNKYQTVVRKNIKQWSETIIPLKMGIYKRYQTVVRKKRLVSNSGQKKKTDIKQWSEKRRNQIVVCRVSNSGM